MAVYKVIQDIEAEDKLLGPLTLKGFVYAGIAVILAYINFRLLISAMPVPIKLVVLTLTFIPMLLFGVLASPLGREQPTEVWLLARIRFMLKPRERLWKMGGSQELVTITVPKKAQIDYTKGLKPDEVSGRLEALAKTLDSRGWVVKNLTLNVQTQPDYKPVRANNERLAGVTHTKHTAPVIDVRPADDILDEKANPTAQNFQNLIDKSEEDRKRKLADAVKKFKEGAPSIVAEYHKPAGEEDTEELLEQLHKRAEILNPGMPERQPAKAKVTAKNQTVKLELAQSGNDLSVASISKLANTSGDSEVVVPLH